jgi:NADPH-dependent ferric siderophore reductase
VQSTERVRREPPTFRAVTVRRTELLTPSLARVVLGGSELSGFALPEPAASVRLLVPSAAGHDLVMPTWNGNQFLLPDGRRPVIRTLTPRRFDEASLELDVEIVVHEGGAASEWSSNAEPGDRAAVSGPGRGYRIDLDAAGFVIVGDETALPAIAQLLEWMPSSMAVDVHVEAAEPDAVFPLAASDSTRIEWHVRDEDALPGRALVEAIKASTLTEGTRIWAAGEAAAMHQIRHHLFDERGLSRSVATVRGYWKHGRTGGETDSTT